MENQIIEQKAQEAKEVLTHFARTYDQLIGSEETVLLLKFLTDFATKNPTTVIKLKGEVSRNPEFFLSAIRPENMIQYEHIIEMAKSGALDSVVSGMF